VCRTNLIEVKQRVGLICALDLSAVHNSQWCGIVRSLWEASVRPLFVVSVVISALASYMA
jgi:hypothetical protein